MQLFKKSTEFSDWHGNKNLSQAIAHANDIMLDMATEGNEAVVHWYQSTLVCCILL